ncbi:MAG: polyamine aminopropyltransferase [Burkholderiales bacterium]
MLSGKWRVQRWFERETSVDVSERDGVRSLHLGSSTVQSSMKLSDPVDLVLSYTRAMMSFLLFAPRPKHVVMIGLGGGSLTKFIYHRIDGTRITVVENNPKVITAARRYFFVPEDDERLQVELADGEEWIARHPESCDVLMVDGYDGHNQVQALSTEDFYASARAALEPAGILVVNLWSSDRRYDTYLQRIERVFPAVVCVPAERHGNVAVLAFGRAPGTTRWAELRARARDLEATYGLEFMRMVEGMRRLNPHSDRDLTV